MAFGQNFSQFCSHLVILLALDINSNFIWLAQVNKYPSYRDFTAIGTGGTDFVQSMIVAVESVLMERIPDVCEVS